MENIEQLIRNLTEEQVDIIMSNDNYIKRNFKIIKLSEQRLWKINKLIEEIEEINRNQCPQDILELYNIQSNRTRDQEYFKYLSRKAEIEKSIINKHKKKLLHKLNLTG